MSRDTRDGTLRVLIDTTFARRAPFSGTGIYIQKLCEQLSGRDGIELIEAVNRRRPAPAGGGLGSARNLLGDLWWATIELPRLAARAGADVIHHPLPAISPVARAAQVVTVADLAFERLPDHFDRGFRTYAHLTHRAAARAAAAVVCVSETTAADARSLWGVAAERIVVAPHGPGQDVGGGAERERVHLLYVGDAEPRKNLPALLEAYRLYRERVHDPLPLLLAGSANAPGAGVTVVHRPSPERLAELYRGAVALLHPSLYEGFGLTALEAMSAGAPVIAADSPGVREVCAQAARYVDPRDPPSFAAAIAELVAAPALRRELAARGRLRAAAFSWPSCARAHVDAYDLALARA